jgi:hypothetical protein
MANRTDQPPEQPSPRTCTGCGGQKGFPETATGTNGAQITTWRTCTGCGGTGVQGGGV